MSSIEEIDIFNPHFERFTSGRQNSSNEAIALLLFWPGNGYSADFSSEFPVPSSEISEDNPLDYPSKISGSDIDSTVGQRE